MTSDQKIKRSVNLMNNSIISLLDSSAINLNFWNVKRFHKTEEIFSKKTTDRRLRYTLCSRCSQSKTVGWYVLSLRFQKLQKETTISTSDLYKARSDLNILHGAILLCIQNQRLPEWSRTIPRLRPSTSPQGRQGLGSQTQLPPSPCRLTAYWLQPPQQKNPDEYSI